MNVLFVSAEVAPFAKTGGLGDVAAALPRALSTAGATQNAHDVRIVMPMYASIEERYETTPILRDIALELGGRRIVFSVHATELPHTRVPVYMVRCPGLYGRRGIYTNDPDEHIRFALLNWAALIVCQLLGFRPDIVHANDWQSSLLPLLLRTMFAWDRLFAETRTVLTIHNVGYQGVFDARAISDIGLAEAAHHFHQEQLRDGHINFLLTGALYANALTTVSPTYAKEIQRPEHGMGLDPFLRARSNVFFGILNGIDETEWSPELDPHIPRQYSIQTLADKEINKRALVERSALPYRPEVAVIGIVSRFAWQKGFDLCSHVLPDLLSHRDFQLVVLGTGEPSLEALFTNLARRFPRQVSYSKAFSEPMAHLIEAGSDLFLMPSRYEPCGLNQMYSLRYGTIPIVHRTGGLADTVLQFDPARGTGNGFVFDHFDESGLRFALGGALETWGTGTGADRETWRALQTRGMRGNFGWAERVRAYEQVYRLVAPGR